MISAAILAMAAVACSSFAAQFGVMSSWLKEQGIDNVASGTSSAIADAASEASLSGGSAHLLLVLPYPATLNASGSSLTATSLGSSVEMRLLVNASGGGTGRIFEITANASGMVLINATG